MATDLNRAQVNLLLLGATWLDLRGWTVDTTDHTATIDAFARVTELLPPAHIEEAIGRAMAHFHGRPHYQEAALQLARRLNQPGLLRQLRP